MLWKCAFRYERSTVPVPYGSTGNPRRLAVLKSRVTLGHAHVTRYIYTGTYVRNTCWLYARYYYVVRSAPVPVEKMLRTRYIRTRIFTRPPPRERINHQQKRSPTCMRFFFKLSLNGCDRSGLLSVCAPSFKTRSPKEEANYVIGPFSGWLTTERTLRL